MSSSLSIINYQLSIINDHVENLRANSFQQGEDDAPMEDHNDDQSQKPLTSREIQEVHKIRRNQLEDQVS